MFCKCEIKGEDEHVLLTDVQQHGNLLHTIIMIN